MKGDMSEESMNKIGMVVLGVLIVIILMFILTYAFKGSKPARAIICGILWLLPGGGVLSGYVGCAAVPV